MSEDPTIKEDELQILLNVLGEKLELSFPPYNFNILEAQLTREGCKINLTCKERDFEDYLAYDWFDYEMPRYNDLAECLLNAGITQYSNLDEFKKRANTYRNLKRNIRFSPDTNLLYHGFFSNDEVTQPDEVLIMDIIRDEVEAQLNHKYTGNDISNIKRGVKYQRQFYDELLNRRNKRSRKAAFLAMRDYLSIRDKVSHYEGIEKSRTSSEENDVILVKSLKEYQKTTYGLPVLLTADDTMTDICELHGIEYFLFKFPQVHLIDYGTFKQMRDLVLNLAGVFGFIKLNSVIIFGEYIGKRALDEYKIRFLDKKKKKSFLKNLLICRKLIDLKILR